MNLLRTKLIICILALFLFSACSKKDEFKPYLKGDIIGYAFCFDEFGNKTEDFSGIKVYTLPNRKYSAITEKDGRYVLKDVINGTYDLSFEKEGFGTMKLVSIKHLGGKPTVMNYYYGDKAPFIYQNITTQIANLEIVNDSIKASLTLSSQYEPYRLQLRLFFSTTKGFDIESAQADKNMVTIGYNDIYHSLSPVTEGLPFDHGQTVYYKACIYTITNALLLNDSNYIIGTDTYFDYDNNKTIYPNLSNASKEFSFIMP